MQNVFSHALLANGIDDGLPATGYIRLPDVLERIPVSKSTLYKWIAEGKFPKPTKKFGDRIAVWDVQEIRPLL